MFKINNKKAQAITELAVFGAILIYLLGTIIRSAVGNSLTQNENFKAMRAAMLLSWQGSEAANVSRNSASILLVEDRLSPDFNKYGALDRNPYISSGSGTFSYELLYPLTPGQDDMQAQMPITDIYINGQHFPLTSSSYVSYRVLRSPKDVGVVGTSSNINDPSLPCGSPDTPYEGYPLKPGQCQHNQCLRYHREWIGAGTVSESQFENVIPFATVTDHTCTVQATASQQRTCQAEVYAADIFLALTATNPLVSPAVVSVDHNCSVCAGNCSTCWNGINSTGNVLAWTLPPAFITWYIGMNFPSTAQNTTQDQLNTIGEILNASINPQYKLFYTIVANPGIGGTNQVAPQFTLGPPTCISHPCTNQELSADLVLDGVSNARGDLMFDLLRNNDPASFVPNSPNYNLRPYIGWQWAATAGTTAGLIGLNTSNNQFPNYDIDGRLKEVTIFTLTYNSSTGEPVVSYMEPQGGDMDLTWDANSCTPKPGLQTDAEVLTFTQNGTYLQIKEGKLFNPETGQVVRSATKRDTIDLISRSIQLSNNTGRFCSGGSALGTVANDGVTPNPVEVCVAPNTIDPQTGKNMNCFSSEYNIKSTCFDENDNMLYVRSRLVDLRGHFWMTNTSGQLKVKK